MMLLPFRRLDSVARARLVMLKKMLKARFGVAIA